MFVHGTDQAAWNAIIRWVPSWMVLIDSNKIVARKSTNLLSRLFTSRRWVNNMGRMG